MTNFANFITIWAAILLSFALLFKIVDKYYDHKMERLRIDKIKAEIDSGLKEELQDEDKQ